MRLRTVNELVFWFIIVYGGERVVETFWKRKKIRKERRFMDKLLPPTRSTYWSSLTQLFSF